MIHNFFFHAPFIQWRNDMSFHYLAYVQDICLNCVLCCHYDTWRVIVGHATGRISATLVRNLHTSRCSSPQAWQQCAWEWNIQMASTETCWQWVWTVRPDIMSISGQDQQATEEWRHHKHKLVIAYINSDHDTSLVFVHGLRRLMKWEFLTWLSLKVMYMAGNCFNAFNSSEGVATKLKNSLSLSQPKSGHLWLD